MNFSDEILKKLAEDPVPVLNRGYRAKERIAGRKQRIDHWREIAASITANPENVGGGGGPSKKVENCVLKIMALEEEIKEEISALVTLEQETSEIIREFVEDPNYKAVLEHRYVEQKRWEAIAVEMGYTFRWTQELHRRAVREVKASAAARVSEAESALIPIETR